MTIGERIKNTRKNNGISQIELAKSVGISKQTLYKYENDIISNIPSDKIELIANSLKTTPQFIMGWKDNKFNTLQITEKTTMFPIITEVTTGYKNIALESWSGETIEIPNSYLKGRSKEEFFVLRVEGDSMYPHYQDGDIVLILKQSTLNRSGNIGAIVHDGECATLKKIEFVKGEDWLKLIPLNPEYKPRRIEGADLELCEIVGIPKLLIRKID